MPQSSPTVAYCVGAGDTLYLGWITAAGAVWVLALGGWVIVTTLPQWGAIGPWIAYTLHIVFVGISNRIRFKSGRWRRINIFQQSAQELPIDVG